MDTDIRNRKCSAYPLLFPLPDSTPHILVLPSPLPILPRSFQKRFSSVQWIHNTFIEDFNQKHFLSKFNSVNYVFSVKQNQLTGDFFEIEKKDVLVIRSMRNLQQQEGGHRLHRKFGQGGHQNPYQ
ncbi:unnamed protein product [Lactuca virosa]|uniref:Uncharacterized protein n=1 Tax=Lactuca virosa TaxID=75947 RepID=A0AAU9M4C8_9ASTR|nr:unnamed protein product [Lactuca virosa]